MNPRSSFLAVVLTLLALTGCGAREAPDPTPYLLGEYLKSVDVKNDRFPSTGVSGDDRLANFAAHYSADELQSRLLLAFPCAADTEGDRGGGYFDTTCAPSTAASQTAERLGGSREKLHARVLVVKHEDSSLELLTLFLAANQAIDSTGESYAGLEEFRAGNRVLSSSDVILSPADLTGIPGEGEVVTVYGRIKPAWPLYLGGALVALLVAALAVGLLRRLRRRRSAV